MAQYLFDPSEYLTEAQWTGTTLRWENTVGLYTSTVSVSRDSTFKDRVFRVLQNNGTTERYMRSFDSIDADAGRDDVKILTSFYVETSTGGVESRLNIRASGTYAGATGYSFGATSQSNTVTIKKWSAGTASSLGSAAKTITEAAWYWMRVSVVGTALKLRVWQDGTDEPAAWDLEVTNADISAAGWVGVQHAAVSASSCYARLAFLSVGTDGDEPLTPISRALYRKWLRSDGVLRTVLAEIIAVDVTTPTTFYLANRHFLSHTADTPSAQTYSEAIVEAPQFSARATDSLIGGFSINIGEMLIDNADGARDWWLQGNFDGRACTLLVGDSGWSRFSFRPLAEAVVEYVRNDGIGAVSLVLRDRQRLIDGPVSTVLIGGAEDNAERLAPTSIGWPTWIEPVATDPVTLEYQIDATGVAEIGDVYDNVVALTAARTISSADGGTETITTTVAHGYVAGWTITVPITTGNLVAGTTYHVISAGLTTDNFRVSATAGGSAFNLAGTETGTINGKGRRVDVATGKLYLASTPVGEVRLDHVKRASASATVSENLYWLATSKLSLTGYLDPDSFDAHEALWQDPQGIYLRERTNALDVFDDLIVDTLALYGMSRDGLLFLASLKTADELSGDELLTLTDDDMFGLELQLERSLMPLSTIYAQWSMNHQPSSQFALTVDTVTRSRYAAAHRQVVNLTVTNATDDPGNHLLAINKLDLATQFTGGNFELETQPAAFTRWSSYRSRKVSVWTFETHLIGLELRLGDNIRIVYPRWGFENGRNVQVIGIRDQVSRERVQLRVVVPGYSQAAVNAEVAIFSPLAFWTGGAGT